MIQKLKNMFTAGVMSLMLAVPAIVAAPVAVGIANADCAGNGIASQVNTGANAASDSASTGGDSAGCSSDLGTNTQNTVSNLAKDIVNVFSIVIGAVSIIMILYGGFRYITSGGASDKVGNAKNTIIYAIIGLVIVAVAQIIVHFVLSSASSASSSLT